MKQSYYARHQDLIGRSIIKAQKVFKNLRLFPAQVGNFYVKRFVNKTQYSFDGPYKIGTVGQADMNGWLTIPLKKLNEVFDQEDLIAVRVEAEYKAGKTGIKKGSEQESWQNVCIKMGVIHIVVRDENGLIDGLNRFKD